MTGRNLDGIVLLDKPLGLSSNLALQKVKRLFGARKAGHAGSLDPLATGMLPICFGKATRLSTVLLGAHKCYRFTVRLGARTSTGDTEGQIVEECDVPELTDEAIREALDAFLGPQMQVPPMYSALKHRGQRLYELARQGIEVERPPRPIEISTLELRGRTRQELDLETVCSKGTYIRVLAEDIARRLGSCGHVTALRRLWVAPFREEQMVSLDELREAPDERAREAWLVPPEVVVSPGG